MIEMSSGKIIATAHEIIVRFNDIPHASMQAQRDSVTLIGQGANVVVANEGGCKWSVKLDNQQQLESLSQQLGCAITE